MGFLPCPRLHRTKERPAESDEDNSLADDGSDCTVPEILPGLPEGQLNEEGEAIAGFFRPFTPRSDVTQYNSRSVVSRRDSVRFQSLGQKKSRASLSTLPRKLRKKLSREAHSPRRQWQLARSQWRGRTPVNIFGNSSASDDWYDSDAYCIQSPQIAQNLGGSPSSTHGSLLKTSGNLAEAAHDNPVAVADGAVASELTGIEDESRAAGGGLGTPQDEGRVSKPLASDHEDTYRSSTFEAQNSLIDGAACDTPDESLFGDEPFFTPRESLSPASCAAYDNVELSAARSRESSARKSPSRSQTDGHSVAPWFSKSEPDGCPTPDVPDPAMPANRDGILAGDTELESENPSKGLGEPQSSISCSQLETEGRPASGGADSGPFNRIASGYRSLSVYSDPPETLRISTSTSPRPFQIRPQKESSQTNRATSPRGSPASGVEHSVTASTPYTGAAATRIQTDSALGQYGNEINKKKSNFFFLRGPRTYRPIPRKDDQGNLQVSKRISPPSTGSRFVENFDDLVSATESQNRLYVKDRKRQGSEGWLSEGKRVGYGYNFITDVDNVPTQEAPAEQPEVSDSREQQGADRSAGSIDEDDSFDTSDETTQHGHTDQGGDNGDNRDSGAQGSVTPSSRSKGLEAKISQFRESLSIASLAKSPAGRIKRGLSLSRVPKGVNAQSHSKGAQSPAPTVGTDASPNNGRRKRDLLKQWGRPSRSNSTVTSYSQESRKMKLGGSKQGVQTRNNNDIPTDSSGSHTVLGDLAESKQNIQRSSPRIEVQDVPPSASRPTSPRPGLYDGPFDPRSQRLTNSDTSIKQTHEDSMGDFTGVRSAEAWSRMYQNCLPHLSMSDEAIGKS